MIGEGRRGEHSAQLGSLFGNLGASQAGRHGVEVVSERTRDEDRDGSSTPLAPHNLGPPTCSRAAIAPTLNSHPLALSSDEKEKPFALHCGRSPCGLRSARGRPQRVNGPDAETPVVRGRSSPGRSGR